MTESPTSNKPLDFVSSPLLHRYAVTINVRIAGSLGVFDPHGVMVNAITAAHAINLATLQAQKAGWEVCGASIASVGRA